MKSLELRGRSIATDILNNKSDFADERSRDPALLFANTRLPENYANSNKSFSLLAPHAHGRPSL